MQVLHLFDRYLNGTMNWAYNLIRHTPEIQVSIAAPIIIENAFKTDQFSYYYSPFQWNRFSNEWEIPSWQRAVASLSTKHLPLYQFHLAQKVKSAPPGILHAHFANVGLHYIQLAKKLNKPLVVSFYGYDYEKLPFLFPKIQQQYPKLFDAARAIIAEGPHGADILKKMGCPEEKIFIIPLGINIEAVPFFPRKKHPGALKLIQAATFTEKKGHIYTIKAFHQALKDCPNMELTLVGEPQNQTLLDKLRTYVQKNKLKDKVHFLDFIPPTSFHEKLSEFDVFIQPSCYAEDRDCEGGAPVSLLDAQATGMPIIGSTHCDIPFEVIHGKTGLLSPEKQLAPLVQSIKTFYEMDPSTYAEYAKNARLHVETQFNIGKNGLMLASLYKEL